MVIDGIFEMFRQERIEAMKKNWTMLALLGALTVSLAGCGSSAASEAVTETEPVAAESTETEVTKQARDTITYDASEYVTLGDYKGLEVEMDDDFLVTEDDIKKEVEIEIGYVGGDYVESDKTEVEEGDTVNIDYVGKKDGVAFDGGTAEGYNLTIGSGQFIPGFEDGLIGAKVGDVVDLNLTFPEQYQSEELAGQDVVFTVTVNSIMEEADPMTYEGLTDEWVQEKMNMDSVEDYLEEVRSVMQGYMDEDKETEVASAVLEELRKVCTVSAHPEGLDEERVEQSMDLYRNSAEANGMDLDSYLSVANQTEEGLRQGLMESAKNAVDTELILMAIADVEGISDDEAAYQKYVQEICDDYSFASPEELYKLYDESYVRRNYCMDTARDLVVENAKVTYHKPEEKETEDAEESEETEEESEEP